MPPRRLNQDANYKQAVGNVIDFKHLRLTRLVKVRVLLPPCALVVRTRATCTEADSRLHGRRGPRIDSSMTRTHSRRACTWPLQRDASRLLRRCCLQAPLLMLLIRYGLIL